MQEIREKISALKDIAGLIGTCTGWAAALLGGYCLLAYSFHIGYFPEGIGFGEGLAFYFVSVCFLLVYLIYVLVCTGFGSLMWSWPAHVLQNMGPRRLATMPGRRSDIVIDYSPMLSSPAWFFGVIGALIFVALLLSDYPAAGGFFVVSCGQGVLVIGLLGARTRLRHLRSGLFLAHRDGSVPGLEEETTESVAVTVYRTLLGLICALPLLLGEHSGFLISSAFNLAQLRKNNATIHVKLPWAIRVLESTLVPQRSFRGEDYAKFVGVKVLLRSVGTKVIIELPQNAGKPINLPIPSDAIEVE